MAKSRSSSKSSKSQGIDLTMVLLAVLVGLIVCSLMKHTDIVEGQFGGGTDGSINSVRSSYCESLTGKEDDKIACNALDTETKCNGSTICYWKDPSKVYSYSGGLEGSIWYEWMRANGTIPSPSLGVAPTIPPPQKWENTDLIPLKIPDTVGEPHSDPLPTSGSGENFYDLITDAAGTLQPTMIPPNILPQIQTAISACKQGWKTDPPDALYNANGGRPIMGYSRTKGLVCRNPYHQPIQSIGRVPRIHLNKMGGCPSPLGPYKGTAGCDTFNTTECNWPDGGVLSNTVSTIGNNIPLVQAKECALPACANMYPLHCLKSTTGSAISDAYQYVSDSISRFSRPAS